MSAGATPPDGPGQLALDFDHRPAFSGEDFLVAPPNVEAVRWLDAWPDWPAPALVVFGPAGSGKTHLAQVFQSLSGARIVSAADLKAQKILWTHEGKEKFLPPIVAGGALFVGSGNVFYCLR